MFTTINLHDNYATDKLFNIQFGKHINHFPMCSYLENIILLFELKSFRLTSTYNIKEIFYDKLMFDMMYAKITT